MALSCATDDLEKPRDATVERGSYWPTDGWRISTPEEQGLDSGTLEGLDAEFSSGKYGYVDSMLVIRNGYLVFERTYDHDYVALFHGRGEPGQYNYYDPGWHPYYQKGNLHSMQSVSKSVTSALVGIAIERGELEGQHIGVSGFFADFQVDSDSRRDDMTLAHLLTMTAGIQWDESTLPYTDVANSCAGMEQSDDWVRFVLDQPMAEDPGSTFVYNSGATQLISHILQQATGMQVHEYAKTHLFRPLGIKESYWKETPKGLSDTEGGLYLTPRDLARIGYLYMKDGVWEGQRLLAEGWVASSVEPRIEGGFGRPEKWKYGYKWWLLNDAGKDGRRAFVALGYGGQRLIVVPDLELIVVFTGWNIYGTPALDAQFALGRVLQSVR